MTATVGWTASRVRAYDCGIETNHDAWRAVHEGLQDGLTLLEISERTGLSYQMVGVYRRQARPSSVRRKLNSHAEGPTRCEDCGAAATHKSARCQRCEHRRQSAHTTGRTENLRAWALRHGHVPTVEQARTVLGVSRSIAGDAVLEAFGPDHREGGQRRMAYRGWPEGAPDVPRPDEVERMREHGRVYGTRNADALREATRRRMAARKATPAPKAERPPIAYCGEGAKPLKLDELRAALRAGRRGLFIADIDGVTIEVRA